MALSCKVMDTSLLRWVVGSLTITCSGGGHTGSLCFGNTGEVHAIIREVSTDPNNTRIANITSSLTIHNITDHTAVSCRDQITQAQDDIRVSSM